MKTSTLTSSLKCSRCGYETQFAMRGETCPISKCGGTMFALMHGTVNPTQAALKLTKQERKDRPLARGLLDYFPAALMEVARCSKIGNDQHNPGEELHWARGKSMDHADCILRHLIDRGTLDDDGISHTAKVAWRALALLQEELEAQGAPMSRASKVVG